MEWKEYYAKRTADGFCEVPESEAGYVVLEKDVWEGKTDMLSTYGLENDLLRLRVEKLEQEKKSLSKELEKAREEKESWVSVSEMLEEDMNWDRDLLEALLRDNAEKADGESGRSFGSGAGYFVLSTAQYWDRNISGACEAAEVWKTVIRTPYDAGLPLRIIRRHVRENFIDGVLGQLGIDRIREHGKNGLYGIPEDGIGTERELNVVYRWAYRANFRDGYWETDIFHNLPVTVPPEFRMRKEQKEQNGRQETAAGKRRKNHA